jgi:hypothetical protein
MSDEPLARDVTVRWSKMSDEPLAREREPIERMRARLEALVMANAALRCGARSKRTGKPCRYGSKRIGTSTCPARFIPIAQKMENERGSRTCEGRR